MQKILVPYDFSKYAESAFQFAYQLAKKNQAAITLLHVIHYPGLDTFSLSAESGIPIYTDDSYVQEIEQLHKKRLAEICEKPEYQDVVLDYQVRVGAPYTHIANHITQSDPDLIVMGTKGTSGLAEMLVGSNTEKVVRFAQCPVISIARDSEVTAIQNIVFALDMVEYHPLLVAQLKSFQSLFGAKLHILWVNTPHDIVNEEAAVQRMQKLAKKYQLANFETHMVRAITTREGILTFAATHKMDMISMITHGYRGLMHLLMGSIAEDVLNHAKCPVLTMTVQEERLAVRKVKEPLVES